MACSALELIMHGLAANGLLWFAVINASILIIFSLSFAKAESHHEWRSLGALSAFIVALFAEMYGFPLTIYVLSGLLASRYPETDPFRYSAGQLWPTLFGLRNEDWFNPIDLASYILVAGGFLLIVCSWRVLYQAQRGRRLAQSGPYSWIRHPQYAGFFLVMLGLLLMWPALSTLTMFPVLTVVYIRLALHEERISVAQFGDEYRRYMAATPAFVPRSIPASSTSRV
jgi:protein-S-isoprenylcysteine O-methyltransferase Ste14